MEEHELRLDINCVPAGRSQLIDIKESVGSQLHELRVRIACKLREDCAILWSLSCWWCRSSPTKQALQGPETTGEGGRGGSSSSSDSSSGLTRLARQNYGGLFRCGKGWWTMMSSLLGNQLAILKRSGVERNQNEAKESKNVPTQKIDCNREGQIRGKLKHNSNPNFIPLNRSLRRPVRNGKRTKMLQLESRTFLPLPPITALEKMAERGNAGDYRRGEWVGTARARARATV